MNIAIIGYGRMGKAIEAVALKNGHEIIAKVGRDNWEDFESIDTSKIDIAVEFSQPEVAYDNIRKCLLLGIPVVSGTTGWLEQKEEIDRLCLEKNCAFFYASNFSIGVNIFFKINEMLAKVMDKFPSYRIQLEELHHIHKKDSPSGTAITLAEGILRNHSATKNWIETDNIENINKEELPIISVREGEIPGTHNVQYKSDIDTITIQHEAHSREGFALGAVLVAEWMSNKKGILGMKDFMNQ